jgi:hypothetical protein
MVPRERPIPTLVYLYGPPAVGKLTVARRLCEITGWTLFHNHLSVNAVRPIFPFGSKPFMDVVHRLRLDVFQTAMAEGMSLIFTNNSAWGGSDGRARFAAFADSARLAVETGGGEVQFVRLTSPFEVLEARLTDPTRQQLEKLTDTSRLRELLRALDDSALYDDDLTVDTSRHSPEEAAKTIAAYIARSHSTGDAPPTSG